MLKKLLQTNDDVAPLIARVMLGLVILPHGLQKTFGLFGGAGFTRTMEYFSSQGMPRLFALLIFAGETLGAIGLIVGCLSRFAASGINLIMLGAIFLVHWQFGFFMNWFGRQQGEGFEYHLLALGLGLIVMLKGSGKWSMDRLLLNSVFKQ